MDLEAQYNAIDLTAIRRFVEAREQENLHLEFKQLPQSGSLGAEERKTLAKVLSGFANSSGGICVWGVKARKNRDGVDAASELVPIGNIEALRSQFESLTGQAADPTVQGVLHKLLLQDDGSGFLVTLVPESESGPHMAKLGEDRFYKRSGDSFYKMEHFDIADMFGRRRRPIPSLRVLPLPATIARQPRLPQCKWVVGIENTGRAVLKYPYLELSAGPPYRIDQYGLDGMGNPGLPKVPLSRRSQERCVFAGAAGDVIHVGILREVTRIASTGPWEGTEGPAMHITAVLGGEDVELIKEQLTIPWEDLVLPTPNVEA